MSLRAVDLPRVIPGTKCGRKECPELASWQVGLRLIATSAPTPAPERFQIQAFLGLGLCHDHRADTVVEDVVTDAGWQQILAGFDDNGLERPDRTRVEVTFTRIEARS